MNTDVKFFAVFSNAYIFGQRNTEPQLGLGQSEPLGEAKPVRRTAVTKVTQKEQEVPHGGSLRGPQGIHRGGQRF